MDNSLRISLMQYPLFWADKTANLTAWQERLAALAGQTDLAILPEMFSTAFCTGRADLAEPMDGTTVAFLRTWSAEYGMAITGSFMATENGKLYNRAFFVTPDGQIQYADKRHLFSMGGEHNHFTAGKDILLVRYKGVNIRILVCYDLRFPVWARNKDNAYDLLVYVANWPARRIGDWDILLPARAVENQSFVCAVNCVGDDGNGIAHNGHSILLDARGRKVSDFADNEQGVQTVTLDLASVRNGRDKFPVWKDADDFSIQLQRR